ncbi:MAG: DUF4011 domain-containing protein [Gammaproteobacteria bacterium]|nr:MAG: DUF4011 domain-containing protein [Gammaproteobacteria bacterium]
MDMPDIQASLDQVRRRLLNLEPHRNRMLHVSLEDRTRRQVHVVDERIDPLYEHLYEGHLLEFMPVPEPDPEALAAWQEREEVNRRPTAREWGKWLGIDMAPELDWTAEDGTLAARHEDKKIQTPYFREELENRLTTLYREYRGYAQETGAHILYVAFGFLEWHEPPRNEQKRIRHAPLLLVPVDLVRGRGRERRRFRIRWNGDEPEINHSLVQLLADRFGLILPEQEDGEGAEHWLRRVAQWLRKEKPGWSLRRRILLGLFNFTNLVLFRDLDPEEWDGDLLDHPLVRLALGYEDEGPVTEADGDEDLQAADEDLQLIHDADASQQAVIRDVLAGRSLLVEGPPGTGKSQTIANLIAALMERGKTVLFVAEKQAALDVVARRLENRGLRVFCLDLHKQGKSTRRVLDEIRQRIDACREQGPAEEDGVQEWRTVRDWLDSYVRTLHTPWKDTELTPHQILGAAALARGRLPAAVLDLLDAASTELDREHFRKAPARSECFAEAGLLATRAATSLGGLERPLTAHPWYGLQAVGLLEADFRQALADLEAWQAALQALCAQLGTLVAEFGFPDAELRGLGLAALDRLASHLAACPLPAGDASLPWHWLSPEHGERLHRLRRLFAAEAEAGRLEAALSSRKLPPDWITSEPRLHQAREALTALRQGLVSRALERATLEAMRDHSGALAGLLDAAEETIALLDEGLQAWLSTLPVAERIENLRAVLETLAALPEAAVTLRNPAYDDPRLDPLLTRLEQERLRLGQEADELEHVFRLEDLPETREVEAMVRVLQESPPWLGRLRSRWRAARRRLGALAAPRVRFREQYESTARLLRWMKARDALAADTEAGAMLPGYAEGRVPLEMHARLRTWYRAVRERWGWRPQPGVAEALFQLDDRKVLELQRRARLDAFTERLATFQEQFQALARHFAPLQDPDGEPEETLERLHAWLLCLPWQAEWQDGESLDNLLDLLERRHQVDSTRRRLLEELQLQDPRGENEEAASLDPYRALVSLDVWLEDAALPDGVRRVLRAAPDAGRFGKLASQGASLAACVAQAADGAHRMVETHGLDIAAWGGAADPGCQSLVERNARALEARERLRDWARLMDQVRNSSLPGVLIDALIQGRLLPGRLEDGLHYLVFSSLARELIDESPILSATDDLLVERNLERFRLLDAQLNDAVAARIARALCQRPIPAGMTGRRVIERTDGMLIEHLMSQRRPRMRPRQVLQQAESALKALMPCFLMSPDSVARILPRRPGLFDVVIMDEASQILPEEALGSLARATQAVVVGDRNQLPPTTFFQRFASTEDDDLEEYVPAVSMESILECLGGLPQRSLTWHYRSRDPRLIAFSNHHFYRNRLVLFPSARHVHSQAGHEDSALVHVYVEDGVFEQHVNSKEAEQVVALAVKYLLTQPDHSLGIVAMNQQQRDLIERMLERYAEQNDALRVHLDAREDSAEPVFVKNLENVQGDERDIMVLSLTYGPRQPGERVPQRFGPINLPGGERRLNVLFTRAREKMIVVTSMRSMDIVAGPDSPRGVQVLHDFLRYLETGELATDPGHPTGRPAGSPFEEAVLEALTARGWSCESQWGVSGYFVDIAVRDPDRPDRFLAAVECNGAAFHSSRTARERDRLRQQVLESLGWKILRVWSTDWFREPDRTLDNLHYQLLHLRESATGTLEQTEDEAGEPG